MGSVMISISLVVCSSVGFRVVMVMLRAVASRVCMVLFSLGVYKFSPLGVARGEEGLTCFPYWKLDGVCWVNF